MKKLLSLSSMLVAAFAFGGCASDQAPSTEGASTEQSVIVASGEKPRALGIGSYEIYAGAETFIHLRDFSGVEIGTVRGVESAGTQESSIQLDSSDAPLVVRREGQELAVIVGTVEKVRVRFSEAGVEVLSGEFPRELTREMEVLQAVLNDPVLGSNLADLGTNMCTATEDGQICSSFASKIPNCPWWVTLGACATFPSFAGAVVCGACVGAAIGNAIN
ncbi:MAG: hypothetical protein HY698_18540 [Deltaproteobacteria bacterium]|nr:hypothetical protein [Deltaproteobacteria bacterium]